MRRAGNGVAGVTPLRLRLPNTKRKAPAMTNENFKPDAQTLNAITSAMGAVVMCITHNLSAEQRAGVARDLARLAVAAEKNGDTVLETLLIDLNRAAQ